MTDPTTKPASDLALALVRRAHHLQHCPAEPGLLRLAVECCRRALDMAPDDPRIAAALARALHLDGQTQEADKIYGDFLAQHPDAIEMHLARLLMTIPSSYKSGGHVFQVRAEYDIRLRELEVRLGAATPATCRRLFKQGLSYYPYLLAYQGFNNAPLQKRLGKILHRALQLAYPELADQARVGFRGERPRIGFVSNQFYQHTIWQTITRSWLSGLANRGFDCYGYAPNNKQEDECTAISRSSCVKFDTGSRSLREWASLIRADCPHVLIYPSLGYSAIIERLALLRLAPVQCLTAGHWETSGFPTLDYFISSDLMEPDDGDAHYSEHLIRLPDIGFSYPALAVEPSPVRREDFGLSDQDILYISPHVPHKYLPWHDELYVRIAAHTPRARLIFFRSPSGERASRLFEQRLREAFAATDSGTAGRLVFFDRMPRADYHALLALTDVYLDVPGWGGGTTTAEALNLGIPVVTLIGAAARSRMAAAMLRHLGIPELVAETEDDYVGLAVRLGSDLSWRQALRKRLSENKTRLQADGIRLDRLAEFLMEAIRTSSGSDRVGRERATPDGRWISASSNTGGKGFPGEGIYRNGRS